MKFIEAEVGQMLMSNVSECTKHTFLLRMGISIVGYLCGYMHELILCVDINFNRICIITFEKYAFDC